MKSQIWLEKISWNQAYLTDAICTRQLRLSGLKVAGNAEKTSEISWNHLKFREISWNHVKSREITWIYIKFREITWNFVKSREISWNHVKISWNHVKILWNYVKFREINLPVYRSKNNCKVLNSRKAGRQLVGIWTVHKSSEKWEKFREIREISWNRFHVKMIKLPEDSSVEVPMKSNVRQLWANRKSWKI